MQRIDGLQWGRGIAALAVVFAHALVHPLPGLSEFPRMLGIVGVTLFFVISGFIMVVTTGQARFDPLSFLAHRLLRIAPLYYLLTSLTAILVLALPSFFKHTVFEPGHFLMSLLFIPDIRPESGEIVPLLKLGWTLNFEMFFYVVFALLFWMRAMARAVVLTVLFVGLAVLGGRVAFESPVMEFYTRNDILSFVAGTWVGIAFNAGLIMRFGPAMRGILAFGVLLLTLDYLWFASWIADKRIPIALICAAAVWVLAGFFERQDSWILTAISFAGDSSYSIYLAHMFAIGGMVAVLPHLIPGVSYPALVVASVLAGIGLGIMCYLVLERPVQRATRAWLKTRKRLADDSQPAE